MPSKKTPPSKGAALRAHFNQNRNRNVLISLAIAVLVGGLGYVFIFQSDAASTCRTKVLRVGSSGNCVVMAQRFVGAGDDGRFGTITRDRVKAFQRNKGLVPDGTVGTATWREMCKELNRRGHFMLKHSGTVGCYNRGGYWQ